VGRHPARFDDRWAIANSLNNLGNVALTRTTTAVLDPGWKSAAGCCAASATAGRSPTRSTTWATWPAPRAITWQPSGCTTRARRSTEEFDDRRALAYLLGDTAGLAAVQGQTDGLRPWRRSPPGCAKSSGSRLACRTDKLDRMLAPVRESSTRLPGGHHRPRRSMTLEQAIDYASTVPWVNSSAETADKEIGFNLVGSAGDKSLLSGMVGFTRLGASGVTSPEDFHGLRRFSTADAIGRTGP
jgi:hypothetical protein